MRCPKCEFHNPAGMNFCGKCRTALGLTCPNCSFENPPGFDFCGQCAAALQGENGIAKGKAAAAKPAAAVRIGEEDASQTIDGERKTVTALFADIKGSTELMEDLDPEEARTIIDPALRIMVEAVRCYDGYVVQSTGDGIFALFGAPAAYEDHPQRALYAALQMEQGLREYGQRRAARGQALLEARVGINTGEVVMRSVETGGRVEYTPIGHTANLASRLQTIAPAGSIAVSEHTRRLVEGYFELRALGPTAVRGISEAIEVFEVTGLGSLRTHFDLSTRRGLTRFVGRKREVEQLQGALEQAMGGRGQIVAVMAEAGVGKSRLCHEFKATLPAASKLVEAYSVSHGKASAWLPVLELLRRYFGIVDADDAATRREKVRATLAALEPALSDALPFLLVLLGVQDTFDPIAQMDPQIKRQRTLDAIKRIVVRESQNQLLVVIFEDLHWIDEQTQALLDLLADSIANARVVLVVNYRPQYRHDWGNKSHYIQIGLKPLGRESAEQLLTALLEDALELQPLKRLIIERTGGNPFFIEEMVQALFDEGTVVRNGVVKVTRSLSQLRLPPTVQGILAARIDRLSAEQKELLQTLAVIGRESLLGLIRNMTAVSEAHLERTVAELRAAEFIYEQPTLTDTEYIFKHALTQEVAYNSLLRGRRRAIHEQTARAIEALHATHLEDHYSGLAHHYLRGNDAAKAIHYAQLAAEQALSRGAYPEATSLVEAGLKLLDKLPEGNERERAELALRSIENMVALVLYGASSPERERAIRRMCELGEKLGEVDQVLGGFIALSHFYFIQGESARGLELSRRCVELAEATQDAGLLADTRLMVGSLAGACGKLREAVSNFKDAMRHSDRTRGTFLLSSVLCQSAIACESAQALQLLGRVGEAVTVAEDGLRYARESKHLFSLGLSLTVAGEMLHCYRLEPEIVRAHAEEAIALSEENGFAQWLPYGRFHHGWALAELGQLEQGVTEMAAGVAGFRRLGGVPNQQYAIALLAQGYARMGRTEEALGMLNEALVHIEHTGERVAHAEMLRLKGELLLLMRGGAATAEAEEYFRAALAVARAQEARWWELRTAVSLARLLRDTNRRDEARASLAEIYNWFTEGFDTADLKRAKALLDDLDG
jgi:class 3 adenylate cyclase/predicted ATPase